jgi:hypothetical protein
VGAERASRSVGRGISWNDFPRGEVNSVQQTVTTSDDTVASFGGFRFGGLQCITGRFNLLFFTLGEAQTQIFPPQPGDVIGQIQPLTGGPPIPVIQTQATNIPLANVDNQIVTLCGIFVVRPGQRVFDVRLVLPARRKFPPFPFPFPFGGKAGI